MPGRRMRRHDVRIACAEAFLRDRMNARTKVSFEMRDRPAGVDDGAIRKGIADEKSRSFQRAGYSAVGERIPTVRIAD